jgi:2-C-methyl-D-erythritol 2,4-cyclodiphosphate synthase
VIATGIGWDVHRLVPGRPLILGGVEVESELGLDGHSDADVLTHAVIDALLGAIGAGDIGEHFPDTEEEWRGADSLVLLRHVDALLGERGAAVVNVDATIMLERPKLLDHKPAMRANIAEVLGLALNRVNVKATRGEGMGFIGRVEGAAALAIATIELPGVAA